MGSSEGTNSRTSPIYYRRSLKKEIAAILESSPGLKLYMPIKGKWRGVVRHHHVENATREHLVDPEAVVIESCGGLCIPFTRQCNNENPRVVRAIGLWTTGRILKVSIRHVLALLRKCTCRHSFCSTCFQFCTTGPC